MVVAREMEKVQSCSFSKAIVESLPCCPYFLNARTRLLHISAFLLRPPWTRQQYSQSRCRARRAVDMAYTDDAVKAKLSALNETQESIVTVAQWVMFHRYNYACLTSCHIPSNAGMIGDMQNGLAHCGCNVSRTLARTSGST